MTSKPRHMLAKYLGGDPRLPKPHESSGTNAVLRAFSNGSVEVILIYGLGKPAPWAGADPVVSYQRTEILEVERVEPGDSGLDQLYDIWTGLRSSEKFRLRVETDEVVGGQFEVLLSVSKNGLDLKTFIEHREDDRERSVWLVPWAACILGEEIIRQQVIEILANEPARSDGMIYLPCLPTWVGRAMDGTKISDTIWECHRIARGQAPLVADRLDDAETAPNHDAQRHDRENRRARLIAAIEAIQRRDDESLRQAVRGMFPVVSQNRLVELLQRPDFFSWNYLLALEDGLNPNEFCLSVYFTRTELEKGAKSNA